MMWRYAMGEKTETPSQNFQIGLLIRAAKFAIVNPV